MVKRTKSKRPPRLVLIDLRQIRSIDETLRELKDLAHELHMRCEQLGRDQAELWALAGFLKAWYDGLRENGRKPKKKKKPDSVDQPAGDVAGLVVNGEVRRCCDGSPVIDVQE